MGRCPKGFVVKSFSPDAPGQHTCIRLPGRLSRGTRLGILNNKNVLFSRLWRVGL